MLKEAWLPVEKKGGLVIVAFECSTPRGTLKIPWIYEETSFNITSRSSSLNVLMA